MNIFPAIDIIDKKVVRLFKGDYTQKTVYNDNPLEVALGFKKAGAKTLLMSLWKVDDEATSLFMTEFYRNLIAGKDAYGALRTAQEYLRSLRPNPYYWAAFVLLDALI